ncbi:MULTISPECIES: DNA-3-methyladenine glycosylase I [Deefgea]|uniref:DNA-3-methyladenine glycosylase I n=1 Tax=Deefgea chitinilytica TaxID=570276 RepID=A0ABS2C9I1_9NEIS|nr:MULTISPECIES: DNA-3-methyladenine glycosylase I [Deefgea]MBM5570798.1 DNA-3-methyladenine glycosylase I [Deefgea chitinilytica]MBM9888027.1 DNA-3-methyladenine glycosylase I [Deefgea sp. CFH1-16]
MQKMVEIQARAISRKGGAQALQDLLPSVPSEDQFAALPDHRILAMMCKAINQASFNWTVISNKWPQFEEAFFGFDIDKLAILSAEQWEAYCSDTRVVRHWPKIKALMENVNFVRVYSQEYGSFARFLNTYPASNQVELLALLKSHGSRLGGQTGQWLLRYIGKDAFVLTQDVVLALQLAGLDIPDQPTSKRDLNKIQQLFNDWAAETGLPYTHLSKIAAYSVGVNYENQSIQVESSKFKAVLA